MFDWDEFKQHKIAVHCNTGKKADAFLEECDGRGIKWCDGTIATNFRPYEDDYTDTCFAYSESGIYCLFIDFHGNARGLQIVDYPFISQKIVITTDENTTLAELYLGGEVIRTAKSVCCPDDKFDFATGAEIAFNRLLESEFVPHLEYNGENFGTIGEETDMTAPFGEKLYVGDIVELYDIVTHTNCGKKIICYDESDGYFIMGIAAQKFKNGISNSWQIRKVRPYKDLKHNEKVNSITVKLKEDFNG